MFSLFDIEPKESSFEFTDSSVVSSYRTQVAYLEPPYKSDAKSLVDFLSGPIRSLDALVPFPSEEFAVRISFTPHLKPMKYRMEFASQKQGMLVNADFRADPRWSIDFFSAFVIHQILQVITDGRVTLEPNHALLDGFSLWWTLHYRPAAIQGTRVNPYLLQALYAHRIQPVTVDRLRQWDITSEILGDGLGMTLSYSGWHFLEELVGAETVRQFAQSEYSRPVHGDVRDWWSDWRAPVPDRFKSATGLDWEEFISIWINRLDALLDNPDYALALGEIPLATASITAEVSPEGYRTVRYKLVVDKPLPHQSECTAFHGQLPSYDLPLGSVALREVTMTRPDKSDLHIEHILSGQYADGTRIYAAIECELSGFDLPVRLASARLTIQ